MPPRTSMNIATLGEIKKQLALIDPDEVRQICLRLGRFKKENKELLNYLLFESHDEERYIETTKQEILGMFQGLPSGNGYFIKKSLRKILRAVNRQIKYSGIPQTELALRIFFCSTVKAANIPLWEGTALGNLYKQQIHKIMTVFGKLPDDLRADYEREVNGVQ